MGCRVCAASPWICRCIGKAGFFILTMEDSGAMETVVRPEFVCSLMQSRVLDRFDGTNMQGFSTKTLWRLIILLLIG